MRCLAIDIGASSGRHVLGEYVDGRIETTEVYRFENYIKNEKGTLCWDIAYLNRQILEGLKKCKDLDKIPDTVAIDTWGVDYVLLDSNLKEILPAVSYRDGRTKGVPERIDMCYSRRTMYRKTGIQRANYNTIYQLFCDKESGKIRNAEHMLLMPEYLSFKLTGVLASEYTIASTTSLLNAETREWDVDLILALGIKRALFKPILMPGSVVGNFSPLVKDQVGFDAKVLFAPAHDTASAVAACELSGHRMYISSGTWSLIGVQSEKPVLSNEAMDANFTNEGGVNNTYRILKNIMGMWLFQNIRKNLDKKYTYDEMMCMAMESNYTKTFNPNDQRLVAPENMIEAIRECLNEPELPLADVISSVYHSLANSYKNVVLEIEKLTNKEVEGITIVGGGSKDTYLNSLTEKYTGKAVTVGPSEATALGNLMVQFDVAKKLQLKSNEL